MLLKPLHIYHQQIYKQRSLLLLDHRLLIEINSCWSFYIRKKGGWDTIEIESKGIRQLIRGRNKGEKERNNWALSYSSLCFYCHTRHIAASPVTLNLLATASVIKPKTATSNISGLCVCSVESYDSYHLAVFGGKHV